MALLFYSVDKNDRSWGERFEERLSGIDVRVWPDVGDRREIEYVVAWQPTAEIFAGLSALRAVFSLGAGVDHLLDLPIPAEVPIIRLVDDGLTGRMVEYVTHHVLRHHLNQPAYDAAQRAAAWRPLRQKLAAERVVGILGLGEIGRASAVALAGLGFQMRGWSRTEKAIPNVACYAGAAQLGTFLAGVEILVSLLPLTDETRGLLNADLFAAMAPGGVLISAGRGAHLDEEDLLEALAGGRLAAATLDVFAEEPLPATHPFWCHPHITVTPHVAGQTTADMAVRQVVRGLDELASGVPLSNVVDRDRGY